MPRKNHLNSEARQKFDYPPILTSEQKQIFLKAPEWATEYVRTLQTPSNKVGFLLQVGYFRIVSRFFVSSRYHQSDVDFVAERISIDGNAVQMSEYTKIYYEEYGRGTPLLLLHQGLGSIENLSGIIPMLSEHYRIIAPDAPGHGRSGQADSLSGELLADYASKFIGALKLDSAYVLGWSMGGNTALLLAANRPDKIKKVVSGASNINSSGLTQQARDLLKEYTVEAVKEDKDWLQHYQAMNPQPEKWIKFWQDTQKMWSREIKIPDNKLSAITIPVLIIRGDRDMIRLEHSVSIFQSLKNGQLCIYPNAGHEMPDEKGDVLSRIAIDFFNEGKPDAAGD